MRNENFNIQFYGIIIKMFGYIMCYVYKIH